MSRGRGKLRLTVGSLRGVPQYRAPAPPGTPGQGLPALPPAKRGKGCCRKGCRGCPWAEAQRSRLRGA